MKLLSMERRLGRSLMMCINNWREGTKRTEPGSSQWWPVTTESGHKLKPRRFPWNIRKHFYCKGDRALVQITQRGRESLSLEILQRPPGHDPGKPAVGHSSSAWAGGWTRWSPEVPSHLSHAVILRLFLPWFLLLQKLFFSNDKTAHSLLSPLTSNKMKKYLLYKYEILALWLFM